MKAWVVHQPGPVDGGPLRLVDRAVPEPGPNEIRVRVTVCGVCRTDLHLAEGDLAPHGPDVVPGHEVVGTVDALGPGADRFSVGARVGIAWLRHTCGTCRFCRRGDENLCLDPRFTGWDADGGYAEHAVVHEDFAYRLPTRSTTSTPHPCSARGSSASGPCGGPTCRPAAGWASTGSGRRPTWPPRWRWPRAPPSTS